MKWLLSLFFLTCGFSAFAQNVPKKWSLAFDFRQTLGQGSWSGVQLGHRFHPQWTLSLAVHHSFYLPQSRTALNLTGSEKPARLFTNTLGLQLSRSLILTTNWQFEPFVMLGWAFFKFDGPKNSDFISTTQHYLATEAGFWSNYLLQNDKSLSIGLAYRPLYSNKLTYSYLQQSSTLDFSPGLWQLLFRFTGWW